MVKKFKDPYTKLYASFAQSAIPIFDSFNTFLEATEPLIHAFHQSTFHLYQSLLSRFVLPEVVTDHSNDLDSIDIYDEENLKDLNNIYIGFMTKQSAGENHLIGTARYRKFHSEARKFFQRCVKYLRKSMPVLKNDVIKSLTFIRVPYGQKATLDELSISVTRFPNVIPQEDITQLETEFLEYQCTSEKELPFYFNEDKIPNKIGFILNEIAKISDPCTGQTKFKHLPKVSEISFINTAFKCVL